MTMEKIMMHPTTETDYIRITAKNSIIALAELHRDGTVKTYPLDSNRDANIITRPKVCKQVGLREMIIYGELGRNI